MSLRAERNIPFKSKDYGEIFVDAGEKTYICDIKIIILTNREERK